MLSVWKTDFVSPEPGSKNNTVPELAKSDLRVKSALTFITTQLKPDFNVLEQECWHGLRGRFLKMVSRQPNQHKLGRSAIEFFYIFHKRASLGREKRYASTPLF
jgi:hypothetical protein